MEKSTFALYYDKGRVQTEADVTVRMLLYNGRHDSLYFQHASAGCMHGTEPNGSLTCKVDHRR